MWGRTTAGTHRAHIRALARPRPRRTREGFTHAGDGHWTAVEPSFNE